MFKFIKKARLVAFSYFVMKEHNTFIKVFKSKNVEKIISYMINKKNKCYKEETNGFDVVFLRYVVEKYKKKDPKNADINLFFTQELKGTKWLEIFNACEMSVSYFGYKKIKEVKKVYVKTSFQTFFRDFGKSLIISKKTRFLINNYYKCYCNDWNKHIVYVLYLNK